MKIRTAKPSDYEIYEESLSTSYLNPSKKKKYLKICTISYEEYSEMLENLYYFEHHIVYEDEELCPVGYAEIEVCKNKMFINYFFVKKDKRRKKYGSLFYQEIEQFAKKGGIEEIEITVNSREAKEFWLKQEFRVLVRKIFIKNVKKEFY